MIEFQKEEQLKIEINSLVKITKVISFIRLLLGVNLIIWVICLLSLQDYVLYGIISAISLVVMIAFVVFTNSYFTRLNLCRKKEQVYQNHYKRREKQTNSFLDEGRDYQDKEDYKLSDLDLFGSKSLFQYLNCSKTKLGRDMLAQQLKNPTQKPKEFTTCISEMAAKEETLELEAGLLEFDDSAKNLNYDEFNSILTNKIQLKPQFGLPLLSFIATIVYIILMVTMKLNPYVLMVFLILNFFLCRIFLKNDIYDLDAFKYYTMCDSYHSLSKIVLNYSTDNPYFIELRNKIEKNMDDLSKIKKVYLSLSTRKNMIANIVVNTCFIYDFWMLFIYNKMVKDIHSLEDLFTSIGEIEVMISFSMLGIDNEEYCVPQQTDGKIIMESLYHPLVKQCVHNSFNFEGGIVLTGSNMSGKTTFMRTIGVNQVLFNAGSIVCAKSFSSFFVPIYTSLRANDMLSEGISTFYAEILRMKKMNEAIQNGKCLILVDEIFKGTNAYERIQASLKVIEKFNEFQSLFIISTHDFELCDAKNITNYHFNEQYIDEKISFDYKIKNGKCESTNAMYLLRMSGII